MEYTPNIYPMYDLKVSNDAVGIFNLPTNVTISGCVGQRPSILDLDVRTVSIPLIKYRSAIR